MPDKENRPAGNGAVNRTTGCNQYIHGLRRRRAASQRAEPLACGCADPWTCRHHDSPVDVDAAVAAGEHLLRNQLGPIYNVDTGRTLWRAGRRDLAIMCVQQVGG